MKINKKERQVGRTKKKKGIKAQRAKPPTQTRAFDALIGDEEQNGKQKKEEKERNRDWTRNSFYPT